MSNLDNPNENNELAESPLDPAIAGDGGGFDDETLADYLARTGKSPVREVSIFAGAKKPKRRKPTFVFPRVPPLL
ncbi:hypothetical protein [Bradyrhizobium sp. ORS 111]|uniref:hypothetical protein n=1 Tax=Bradyrhizobium sp. ORS 111 TaxID=1685958 RepID=UPI003890DF8D